MGGAHDERRRKNPTVNEFLQHQRPESLTGLSGLVAGQVSQVAVPRPDLEIRAQPGVADSLLIPRRNSPPIWWRRSEIRSRWQLSMTASMAASAQG